MTLGGSGAPPTKYGANVVNIGLHLGNCTANLVDFRLHLGHAAELEIQDSVDLVNDLPPFVEHFDQRVVFATGDIASLAFRYPGKASWTPSSS